MVKPSLWYRAYRIFRIRVLHESPLLYETFDEMCARQDEYFKRPEVIARLHAMPATHKYNRATGKITRIE